MHHFSAQQSKSRGCFSSASASCIIISTFFIRNHEVGVCMLPASAAERSKKKTSDKNVAITFPLPNLPQCLPNRPSRLHQPSLPILCSRASLAVCRFPPVRSTSEPHRLSLTYSRASLAIRHLLPLHLMSKLHHSLLAAHSPIVAVPLKSTSQISSTKQPTYI